MAEQIYDPNDKKKPSLPPATTPEDYERRLQMMAFVLAEKQLKAGTISATVHAQLIKSATTRDRIEQQKLLKEVELLERKAESMESAIRMEAKYDEAIAAMREYGGHDPQEPMHE